MSIYFFLASGMCLAGVSDARATGTGERHERDTEESFPRPCGRGVRCGEARARGDLADRPCVAPVAEKKIEGSRSMRGRGFGLAYVRSRLRMRRGLAGLPGMRVIETSNICAGSRLSIVLILLLSFAASVNGLRPMSSTATCSVATGVARPRQGAVRYRPEI